MSSGGAATCEGKRNDLQVREEAQGISAGWPGGTPKLALKLTQGGETAALPAYRDYLQCRLQSSPSAGPSGR